MLQGGGWREAYECDLEGGDGGGFEALRGGLLLRGGDGGVEVVGELAAQHGAEAFQVELLLAVVVAGAGVGVGAGNVAAGHALPVVVGEADRGGRDAGQAVTEFLEGDGAAHVLVERLREGDGDRGGREKSEMGRTRRKSGKARGGRGGERRMWGTMLSGMVAEEVQRCK